MDPDPDPGGPKTRGSGFGSGTLLHTLSVCRGRPSTGAASCSYSTTVWWCPSGSPPPGSRRMRRRMLSGASVSVKNVHGTTVVYLHRFDADPDLNPTPSFTNVGKSEIFGQYSGQHIENLWKKYSLLHFWLNSIQIWLRQNDADPTGSGSGFQL
jgi:hypothetical protein